MSEWVGYNRPAVDWMVTEEGNPNKRLIRTMHDFPQFADVVNQIPRPLSRQDVYNCYMDDLYKGYVATLLWDNFRREPFHIYYYLPFLATEAEEVRIQLAKTKNHLQQGDMSLSELFKAMNDPVRFQIAPRINHTRFSLAMDFMSSSNGTIHPLLLNQKMMSVHCALLLEEQGLSQSLYSFEETVSASQDSSLANCYEDYCRRIGDIALWAGSGNPEFLIDWLNYTEDGYMMYLLAKDTISEFRTKQLVYNMTKKV